MKDVKLELRISDTPPEFRGILLGLFFGLILFSDAIVRWAV